MKYGHEIAKKVILGLSPQKDNPLQTVSNKMPAFTKSYKMAVWTCRFLKSAVQSAVLNLVPCVHSSTKFSTEVHHVE